MFTRLRNKNKKISRKSFFKWVGITALIPLGKIWHDSVEIKQVFSSHTRVIVLHKSLPDGVHFYEEVILIKNGNGFQLFSSKCTHLGCRINKMENDQLLCPCHGSKYNLNGEPVAGPALQPLEQIEFQTTISEGKLIIRYKF